MRVGKLISRIFAPGWGRCRRCETAWKFIKGRNVPIPEKDRVIGMYVICIKCWDECNKRNRSQYYLNVNYEWFRDGKITLGEHKGNRETIIKEILES